MERGINGVETGEQRKTLEGESLLSMHQLNESDILGLIDEADAAITYTRQVEEDESSFLLNKTKKLGIVMKEPSTRAVLSMTTAMDNLGGARINSDIDKSSEAKGETITDTWLALATYFNILGIRTPDNFGPHNADELIREYYDHGKLRRFTPIINLGDGTNEHPTQALSDLFTISKHIPKGKELKDIRLTMVGDHERYRQFHSLIIGAQTLGMTVRIVESPYAKLPEEYQNPEKGEVINYGMDLDSALEETDVLYIGRNPEEYTIIERKELKRIDKLKKDYHKWHIDHGRIQLLPEDSIVLHPRPRDKEVSRDIDFDPRMQDVAQMDLAIYVRMAIISQILGYSIKDKINSVT